MGRVRIDFEYVRRRVREVGAERLVFVHNPRSSKAVRVKAEMLEPLVAEFGGVGAGEEGRRGGAKGVELEIFEVEPTNVDDNAEKLAKRLRDGDAVVVAGGDGTASIGLNGCMLSGRKVYFTAVPYGNFNDMARSLAKAAGERGKVGGGRKGVREKGGLRDDLGDGWQDEQAGSSGDLGEMRLYPLEARVNGEHFRYAACYFTVGLFAESTEIFDGKEMRKGLQTGKKSMVYSVRKLMGWYFKNKKRTFLPEFRLVRLEEEASAMEEGDVVRGASDYMAVNGVSVAKMMRGGKWYLALESFRSATGKLTSFLRLCVFMGRSVMVRVPGVDVKAEKLVFSELASFEIQAEGEYKRLTGVRELEIRKCEKSVIIL